MHISHSLLKRKSRWAETNSNHVVARSFLLPPTRRLTNYSAVYFDEREAKREKEKRKRQRITCTHDWLIASLVFLASSAEVLFPQARLLNRVRWLRLTRCNRRRMGRFEILCWLRRWMLVFLLLFQMMTREWDISLTYQPSGQVSTCMFLPVHVIRWVWEDRDCCLRSE
jgi:hypothetical protein